VEKILFVDDDPNVLASYQREYRKKIPVDVAEAAAKGLEFITDQGPYAVIVSDYRMPGMDGIDFLSVVQEIAPQSVCVLLTGYADLEIALRAVNEINIFRLLTKPCPPDVLIKALAAGIKQYRLVTAERELLEKTVKGCVKVMSDILAMAKPEAFSRTLRIARYAKQLSMVMDDPNSWETETAAQLSQIGLITVPEVLFRKSLKGRPVTVSEKELFDRHPSVAARLVENIPRMEAVADIIACHQKNYDGSGEPKDGRKGTEIPFGARILKAAVDFDALISARKSPGEAFAEIKRDVRRYDPRVVQALSLVLGDEARYKIKEMTVATLEEGSILADNVYTIHKPKLLLARGQELSRTVIDYIRRYSRVFGVKEPIRVIYPLDSITTGD